MENLQYVQTKIKSGNFNIGKVVQTTGISRYQIHRVLRGEDVKPFVVITLNDYFRKIGD